MNQRLKPKGMRPLDVSLEKFLVIEGRRKVYSKISQMVQEAKVQLSAVSTISGLLRAEQFGVFDIPINEASNAVQFRLLTEASRQNRYAVNKLLRGIAEKGLDFKVKNPELGLNLFPRMVIRDNEEAIFFITSRTPLSKDEDNLCLWTNCRDLVNAFTHVFEDLWHGSIYMQYVTAATGKDVTGLKTPILNEKSITKF